jgi:hypothetical protein
MKFATYLYKSTLSSPRAAKARKAAYDAVVCSLSKHVEEIEGRFENRDWVVVV